MVLNSIDTRSIGVVDSGIGGISTLLTMQKFLPRQKFLYAMQDNFEPFGSIDTSIVYTRTKRLVDSLVQQDCKAIVVACNTATNIGICALRDTYSIPFVGLEPAIKPAVASGCKNILVLVTPSTAKQDKFLQLITNVQGVANIIVAPQESLASFIEYSVAGQALRNNIKNCKPKLPSSFYKNLQAELCDQTKQILEQYGNIDGIVLGCTHYVFLTSLIKKHCYKNNKKIKIFDGNYGACNRLKELLQI